MIEPAMVERIRAHLREFLSRPQRPAGAREAAVRHRVLPLLFDWSGFFGVSEDGDVVSVAYDPPHTLSAVREDRVRNMALYQGSLAYTDLAPLVPRRPADAHVCTGCGGTGECPGGDRIRRHFGVEPPLCCCGGLGWLPRGGIMSSAG